MLSTSRSSTPIVPHILLEKFNLSPQASSEHLNILLLTSTFWIDTCAIKIVSSAYWRRLTSTFPHIYPLKIFFKVVILIISLKPSATILKRKGVNGSLCLSFLWMLNSLVGFSFTKTEIEQDLKHSLIHLTHFSWKPNLLNMYNKKNSKRPSHMPFHNELLRLYTFSFTSQLHPPPHLSQPHYGGVFYHPKGTLSYINDPWKHFLSLFASTLAKILYIQPTNEISLNSPTPSGFLLLELK